MIDFIKQWVINIVALVLFIVIVEMLLPKGKIKKYVGLVTGVILIISIITPLIGLIDKNINISSMQTSSSNLLDKLQIEKDSEILEEDQMKQIVEVYREKIIVQLEDSAKEVKGVRRAKADVIFNEDYTSKTFGELKRAYLEISIDDTVKDTADGKNEKEVEDGDNSVEVRAVDVVEQVKVGDIKKYKHNDIIEDPILKKNLEEKISQLFGIDKKNIIISQTKG